MRKEKWRNFTIYFDLFFLVFGIIFLFLNIDVISVVHAQASEWLPVIVYRTYSTIEISLLYFLIILIIIKLLSSKIRYLTPVKPYIISITPIITILSIIFLILNPHTVILQPRGWPPTQLDKIEPGGIIIIIFFSLFVVNSFFQIFLEGNLKKSLKTFGLIIGALLLSDLIHESGHAIIALGVGGEITEFYPFPVLLGGEFAAGYVGFSNVPSNLIPLVLLGGEIFQWITVSILLIILYIKPKYRSNLFIVTLLVVGLLDFPLYVINNTIGLPHWFLIGGINGDLIIFSALTGFPLWLLIIFACIQLLIAGLIFYKFFFKNKKLTSKEVFTIQ